MQQAVIECSDEYLTNILIDANSQIRSSETQENNLSQLPVSQVKHINEQTEPTNNNIVQHLDCSDECLTSPQIPIMSDPTTKPTSVQLNDANSQIRSSGNHENNTSTTPESQPNRPIIIDTSMSKPSEYFVTPTKLKIGETTIPKTSKRKTTERTTPKSQIASPCEHIN